MGLVVTRKKGESLRVLVRGHKPIWLTLLKSRTGSASLMIEADPDDVELTREELLPPENQQQQQLQEGAA